MTHLRYRELLESLAMDQDFNERYASLNASLKTAYEAFVYKAIHGTLTNQDWLSCPHELFEIDLIHHAAQACYPFSLKPSKFLLFMNAQESTYAMCAFDALCLLQFQGVSLKAVDVNFKEITLDYDNLLQTTLWVGIPKACSGRGVAEQSCCAIDFYYNSDDFYRRHPDGMLLSVQEAYELSCELFHFMTALLPSMGLHLHSMHNSYQ